MTLPIATVELRYEHDVVLARQRARAVAGLLGFEHTDQTRIGTAVSEIARNAFQYAGGGRVEFCVKEESPEALVVRVTDQGPGIEDVPAVLDGRYRSSTGLGMGMTGARRLMDSFEVESSAGGTTVLLGKRIPPGAPLVTGSLARKVSTELADGTPANPFEEIQRQNQELLRALDEVQRKQEELEGVNCELEDTNRGMVALYKEVDENASRLKKANEVKIRFLSNMGHEFRTPLNAILSLSRILLDRMDGDLTGEQEKQAAFIHRAAGELSTMVNDLLDLAKIEAGRVEVYPAECDVAVLFSGLRGMFRPLFVNPAVQLVIEEPEGIPALLTDGGKVSQILRNLVSNALKFTERGEVRVSARPSASAKGGPGVVFSVSDTGIGVAPEDQERIFEEYGQVDGPLQRKLNGTGLGLPLSRRLAKLLGGRLTVESVPGRGSTFTAVVPTVYSAPRDRGEPGGTTGGGSRETEREPSGRRR